MSARTSSCIVMGSIRRYALIYHLILWNLAITFQSSESHLRRAGQLRYDGDLGPKYRYNNDTLMETKSGHGGSLNWLQGAQDMFASPAGHVMVQVAKELLNRSTGNSQVLSLNLTNLVVILLLKLLIFAAGLLGAGHWGSAVGHGGFNYARSQDMGVISGLRLTENEAQLMMGFLAAQGGWDECLYLAACRAPREASEYSKAALALLDTVEHFAEQDFLNKARYNDLLLIMNQAAYNGYHGVPCNSTTLVTSSDNNNSMDNFGHCLNIL